MDLVLAPTAPITRHDTIQTATLETGKRPWPRDLEPFAFPLAIRFVRARIQVVRCDTNSLDDLLTGVRTAGRTLRPRKTGHRAVSFPSHRDLKPTVPPISTRHREMAVCVKPNHEWIGSRVLLEPSL